MTILFQNKNRIGAQAMTPLDRVVASLRNEQNNRGTAFASSQVSRPAFAMEGVTYTIQHELNSSLQSLAYSCNHVSIWTTT
jgi:hypothetical protein